MPELTNDSKIACLARKLAAWADEIAGDYPLVTTLTDQGTDIVLWQYGRQDIVLRCGTKELKEPADWGHEKPLVLAVPTMCTALELVRQTEQLRQPTNRWPFIRIGPMPGTELNTVCCTHDS